jgi:hypothetical protein
VRLEEGGEKLINLVFSYPIGSIIIRLELLDRLGIPYYLLVTDPRFYYSGALLHNSICIVYII